MNAGPSTDQNRDWTTGAAKWFAVLLLGTASIAGMIWSITSRTPAAWAHEPKPRAVEIQPKSPPPAPKPEAKPDTKAYPREKPSPETAPVPPALDPEKTALPAKLDLNTATAAQLELLPGIGPAIAQRIVEYREEHGKFATLESLDAVKGIGPKTIARLRPLVTVQ